MRNVRQQRRKHTAWELHAESSRLVNVDGNPFGAQPQYPSCYQNFPVTAAELLRWYGDPAGITPQGIFPMNAAAGNQVDALGLSGNFVPNPVGGYPLYNREAVGLLESPAGAYGPATELEPAGVGQYYSDTPAFLSLGGVGDPNSVSLHMVYRLVRGQVAGIMLNRAWGGVALQYWYLQWVPQLSLATRNDGGIAAANGPGQYDHGWHWLILTFDITTMTAWIHCDTGASASGVFTGTLNNYVVDIGGGFLGVNPGMQVRYLAGCSGTLTAANGQSFWRHAQIRGTGFSTTTYARNSNYVLPISASRVACYGPNQLGVGYSAAAVVPGNALGTGIACEDGVAFLGIGSTDLNAWTDTPNVTHAPTDGPSGAMDAIRLTPVALGSNVASATANLAGATNVPFEIGFYLRAGTAASIRVFAYLTGDPGGPEYLLVTGGLINPAVPWSPYAAAVTPAGAAHTGLALLVCPDDGAAAFGTIDFADPYAVQNRNTPVLGWPRVPGGAAVTTALVDTRMVGQQFDPRRGRVRTIYSGAQVSGAIDCLWSTVPNAYMSMAYNGGSLNFTILDVFSAVVALCNTPPPAPAAGRHVVDVVWDSTTPIYRAGGVDYYAVFVIDGVVVVPTFVGTAPWQPTVPGGFTAVSVGTQQGIFRAAKAYIEQCEYFPNPGDVV